MTLVTATFNFFAISEFFQSGNARETLSAEIMLSAILLRACVTCGLCYGALNWDSLSPLLERQYLHSSRLWVYIFVLSLISPVNIRYLPWTANEFSQRSRGFPNFLVFKICYFTVITCMLVLMVFSSINSFSTVTSLFSFLTTLFQFCVGFIEIAVKFAAEKIHLVEMEMVTKDFVLRAQMAKENDVTRVDEAATLEAINIKLEEAETELKKQRREQRLEMQQKEIEISAMKEARRIAMEAAERTKEFEASVKYADETLEVVKDQLAKKGVRALGIKLY